jgi:GT2 family glycosyltransferase
VSAVIPNWNKAELLSKVLADLRRQTHPLLQILVVDNASTDRSVETAEKYGATILRLTRNEGFAHAVNRGIERCESEWVLILNNDVTFGPDWLTTLLTAASSANAWFATGKLRSAADPNTIDGTFDAVSRAGMAWRCGHGRPDGPLWSAQREIAVAPLTATLVRRALFHRIGLLDEAFESYLEDVDFGLRCAANGYTGIYTPQAVADHAGSATLGAWHKATVRRMARNQILLIRKHFGGAPRWPILVGQVLWGCNAVRHGAGLAWLQGKLDGLRLRSAFPSRPWSEIRTAVERSEREIWILQKATGFDLYWRLYFALVRP